MLQLKQRGFLSLENEGNKLSAENSKMAPAKVSNKHWVPKGPSIQVSI